MRASYSESSRICLTTENESQAFERERVISLIDSEEKFYIEYEYGCHMSLFDRIQGSKMLWVPAQTILFNQVTVGGTQFLCERNGKVRMKSAGIKLKK